MFSPYFLRLPQIEMLVSVQYGMPGEVRPIICRAPDSAASYSSIATHPSSGRVTPTAAPDTIEELVLLVETDPEGGEALQRSLDRDPVAIPGAISSGGHVPRPTDCKEKLVNADDADAAHRDKFANGIQELRTYVKEAEEQLRRNEVAGSKWH
ncbi:hypothetical protein B0H14DRAFT_3859903 [Mycena olivaceomarginata]|nr:hypothetical protein B0H14DRAFT_3859903 [Mycena olivaceomarginata]